MLGNTKIQSNQQCVPVVVPGRFRTSIMGFLMDCIIFLLLSTSITSSFINLSSFLTNLRSFRFFAQSSKCSSWSLFSPFSPWWLLPSLDTPHMVATAPTEDGDGRNTKDGPTWRRGMDHGLPNILLMSTVTDTTDMLGFNRSSVRGTASKKLTRYNNHHSQLPSQCVIASILQILVLLRTLGEIGTIVKFLKCRSKYMN